MSLRIVIVEDDPGTREALTAALQLSGNRVVGAFERGEQAVKHAPALRPDVVLADLHLPGISGIQTIHLLRRALPELPILVLTVFETPSVIVEAIEAGAGGYLLKESSLDEVNEALLAVCAGHAPLSATVARHVLDSIRARTTGPTDECNLTEREIDVLRLLVDGRTYASIGHQLKIGIGTVQSHIKNIYRKLQVSSRAEAMHTALRRGMVSLD